MIKLKFVHIGNRDPIIPPILHYWNGENWFAIPEVVVSTAEYLDGYINELGNDNDYTHIRNPQYTVKSNEKK